MKKLLILLLVCATATTMYSQNEKKKKKGAYITFTNTNFDFDTIIFGQEATHEFTFTNTGNEPLTISNVKSTCGCTIPKWSSEEIQSGGTGSVLVKYDSNRSGGFTKGVTVYSNAVNGDIILIIEGTVTPNPNKAILGEPKK